MPTAAYFDPDHDVTVDAGPIDERRAADLIGKVISLSSGRGHPAVEFARDNGTTLSIATDGERAFLVWTTHSAITSTAWAPDWEEGSSSSITSGHGARRLTTSSCR